MRSLRLFLITTTTFVALASSAPGCGRTDVGAYSPFGTGRGGTGGVAGMGGAASGGGGVGGVSNGGGGTGGVPQGGGGTGGAPNGGGGIGGVPNGGGGSGGVPSGGGGTGGIPNGGGGVGGIPSGGGGTGGVPQGGGGAGGVPQGGGGMGGIPVGGGGSGGVPMGGMGGNPNCTDGDNDGYSTCDGDCNDGDPLVNPGAFDFPNGINDDCIGGPDDPNVACDQGLPYTSQDPLEYARAIEICQQTTAGATGIDRIWGLLGAAFTRANGTGTPSPQSHAIVTDWGTALGPRSGQSFMALSTGLAATPSQPYFQSGTPQGGTQLQPGAVPTPPGFPTNKAGCPLPGAQAFDSTVVELEIRTPTNASSFAFDHSFFSAEYPEYACSPFNDLWVVILDTQAPGLPNNGNVVFDAQGTPGSVNLNFFDRCLAGATGCFGTPGFNFCTGGTGELANTGYGADDFGQPCGAPTTVGGGTGWVTSEAPVVPGETITVRFAIWDSSDGVFDSASIVDFFRWQQSSLSGPSTFRP